MLPEYEDQRGRLPSLIAVLRDQASGHEDDRCLPLVGTPKGAVGVGKVAVSGRWHGAGALLHAAAQNRDPALLTSGAGFSNALGFYALVPRD